MSASRQIKLGMFLRPAGHHVAGWRHPDAWADGGLDFRKYVEMARTAERGLFDLMFSANAGEAQNFGREQHLPKPERYRRAREFVDVVRGLWDSWDDDAFLFEKRE